MFANTITKINRSINKSQIKNTQSIHKRFYWDYNNEQKKQIQEVYNQTQYSESDAIKTNKLIIDMLEQIRNQQDIKYSNNGIPNDEFTLTEKQKKEINKVITMSINSNLKQNIRNISSEIVHINDRTVDIHYSLFWIQIVGVTNLIFGVISFL